MSSSDEIHSAISAHGAWKARFTEAVRTGKLEEIAPLIKDDHACDFGAWLFGPGIPASEKRSPHYLKIKSLHAEIHQLATQILFKARSGKRAEALKLLKPEKAFAVFSTSLELAALEWERNWGVKPPKAAPAKKKAAKAKPASKPKKKAHA